MKFLSQVLVLLTAVVTLNGCIDADNATPQQGSKGADKSTGASQ